MGIFDDVVVNAKSAAESVSKKAEKLVDVSKLRINVVEISAEVNKRIQALGAYVYENNRADLAADPEAKGIIAEIDELKAQKDSIQKELLEKKNKIQCPACGKQSADSALFCSACGSKITHETAKEEVACDCGCEETCETQETEE
jgi:hypothetical protein